MTVKELIEHLRTYDEGLEVVYRCYSEQVKLSEDEIIVWEGSEPRPDGWVHDKRPDKPTRLYLMFPGN